MSGGRAFQSASANFNKPSQGTGFLVHFGKVHAVGVLQAGDLPGMELHFKIRRHDRYVDRLALRGAGAFGTNAVEFQIPVMGKDEFVYDSVHSVTIVLGANANANHSKTLEPCLLSTSSVTLPA